MVKSSLKQLLRTPWKALLFFLLMTACTLLLVFGSVMLTETVQRIDEVENSFTTIGMVEQDPLLAQGEKLFLDNDCDGTRQAGSGDIYADKLMIDVLNFEGAKYIHAPESRPYYVANVPQLTAHPLSMYEENNYVQFTALDNMTEHGQPTPIRIDKILCSEPIPELESAFVQDSESAKSLEEGETYYFCECLTFYTTDPVLPLEKGKSYVANLRYHACSTHPFLEMKLSQGPKLRQYNADGTQIETPYSASVRLDEVTDGYWEEGGRGQDWLNAIEYNEERTHLFVVAPTDSLQLIPAFQYQQAYIERGREISKEEFDSGMQVCMVEERLAQANHLQIGDKVSLSMVYAMYNSGGITAQDDFFWFSNMNAKGELYKPFWESDYEIVGTYSTIPGNATNNGALPYQCFIVPQKSIQASDNENIVQYGYMNPWTCTFQIANGTIAEFDAALRENVPEIDSLTVTYNDNGYTDIMASLQSTRTTALLLFAVGLAASIAVAILLLYFFVVQQKKRTAIEQSLGMTKAQCRTSILIGVMILTLLACTVGSTVGAVLTSHIDVGAAGQMTNVYSEAEKDDAMNEATMPHIEKTGVTQFNTKYSLWAAGENQKDFTEEIQATPIWLYLATPAFLWLFVLLLSEVLVGRNLKIDPILLLGGKQE